MNAFTEIDFKKIAEIQDSFFDENGNGTIPLKYIPELTYEIWMHAVDCEALSEETKNIPEHCSDGDILSDGYIDMLECSKISIDPNTTKRGKWYIMYDGDNQIYWKLENDINSNGCIVMDHWVNYVLND